MPPPAKRLAREHCTKDFEGLAQLLQGRNLFPDSPTPRLLGLVKSAHATAYAMYLWRHYVRGGPEHRYIFVGEYASDALQILPHALAGYRKSTALLMRAALESALRHVYFSDHEVEFRRTKVEDWHVPIRDLMEYLGVHPTFRSVEEKFPATARLKELYGKLSKLVHAGAVRHMDMRKALADVVFTPSAFEEQVATLRDCAGTANFILATYHSELITKFAPAHWQIVLDTIPKEGRRVLAGL